MCLGKQTILSPEHRKWRLMTSFTFPQLCPVCEGCGKVYGDSASRSAQASPSPSPSPDFVSGNTSLITKIQLCLHFTVRPKGLGSGVKGDNPPCS